MRMCGQDLPSQGSLGAYLPHLHQSLVRGLTRSPVAGGRDAGAFCEVPHDAMRMTVDRGDR